MHVSRTAVAAIMLAAGVSFGSLPARAQDSPTPPPEHAPNAFQRRSAGSISFIQSRPIGSLRQNIGFGYGVDGAYLFRLDKRGALSLRANVGYVSYGHESFRAPLSTTVGGRIQVKVNTTNSFVPLSIGPQLAWPTGSVRPYANAGVGGQFFSTQSSIEGTSDTDDFAHTTNQSDWTPAWTAGGGVYVPVYQRRTKVMLDAGVQYYGGGRAQYLRPGSIQDLPDGQIAITTLESETHLLLVRLGVRISL